MTDRVDRHCRLADTCRYGFTYDNYTSLWNVLDYCATTVPVSSVSSVKDVKPEHQGRNEVEKKIWDDCRCLWCLVFVRQADKTQICLKRWWGAQSPYSLLDGDLAKNIS